jgi:hypothetical protein
VLWTREGLTEGDVAANAYCIPMSYEPQSIYLPQSKTLLADRYGGFGPGGAGGSGRCGVLDSDEFAGRTQIKGVGITPLVDPAADEFHRSGTMTLEEASHEVIFGEVLSALLPHGALRCDALFLTGGQFFENGPYGVKTSRWRACVQRQFALRPAHYLRNTAFNGDPVTEAALGIGLAPDALRTTEAMRYLPRALGHIYTNDSSGSQDTVELVNQGLRGIANRFAAQVAATVALRINHGALSCGNICLDGRLLDYGITSYVPAFRRHARPPNWQDPLNQTNALRATITSLHLHISKYLLQPHEKFGLLPLTCFLRHFDQSYRQQLNDELTGLCGLFGPTLMACPDALKTNVSRWLVKIGTFGVKESYVHFKAHHGSVGSNPAPRLAGRYDVCEVLRIIGRGLLGEDIEHQLATKLDDQTLLQGLMQALNELSTWLYQQCAGLPRQGINTYLGRQMLRRNSDLSFLQRRTTQKELLRIEQSEAPEDAHYFIENIIARAVTTLQPIDKSLPGSTFEEQAAALNQFERA